MADRYVLKRMFGTETLADILFSSEEEALETTAELFDEHGPDLQLEIWLNDSPPALWNAKRLAAWYRDKRRPLD